MTVHILIVDDDSLLRRSLAFSLEKAGYETSTAQNAEQALAQIQQDAPDLILLDIGLPGIDGLQAVRHFQEQVDIPIVFVTARRRELDEVMGLELGADDYITKPFDLDVLLARVRMVLRRASRTTSKPDARQTLHVGDLVIDPSAHTVTVGGEEVTLTAREFAVLHALALDAGHVVSVEELLTRVWGAEFDGEPQVVYVHIRWLRQKIEPNPAQPTRIVTVRGVGYKLQAIN